MKKFLFLIPVFAFCFCFFGCQQNISNYLKSHVSENCSSYYVAQTNDFSVTLFSGERESNYKLDGVSTQKVDYSILSVKKKSDITFEELDYVVEVDGQTFEGVLTQNPYDSSFEADVKTKIAPQKEVFVYLKFNGTTQVVNLESIFQNFQISSDTALDIAVDELLASKENIDDTLDYECFIQILNKDIDSGMYFWLVNIVSSNGDMFNIIIDISTGEVLAKKL